jgi:putative ABC transport system permease protein
MRSLGHDLRLALRRLRLAPGFTLFAVLSLALGIAVTTVVYSSVRTLMWQPLGVPRAAELMSIRIGDEVRAASWPDFGDLRRQQSSFRSVAASVSLPIAVGSGRGSQAEYAEAVSGEYFAVVGVRPRLGRLLDAADEASGARVAVVSEHFWKTNLDGDPAVVGRSIKLGGEAFELVGVVAGPFHGLQLLFPMSVWMPATSIPRDSSGFRVPSRWLDRREARTFDIWARLKTPDDFLRASSEVALIGRRLESMYPGDLPRVRPREWLLVADGAKPPDNQIRNTVVGMILTGIAAVLLIACTNLANLALARGTARAEETAVRSALGASRWRLVREQLIECACLVAAGGGLGVTLALTFVNYTAVDILIVPGLAVRIPEVDSSVFISAIGAMAMALVVFGLWPSLQSTRANVRSELGAGAGATTPKWRLHRTIIAWQVCGSVALLLVALLSVRVISAAAGRSAAPTSHGDLALAQIDFALNGHDESHMRAITASILDAMRARGSTRSVAAVNGLPFGFFLYQRAERTTVSAVDSSAAHGKDEGRTSAIVAATPSFFATTRTPVLRGRGFTDQDEFGATAVAIVNKQAARELFRTVDVVGRTIYINRVQSESPASPATSRATPPVEGPVGTTIVGVCGNDEPWVSTGRVNSVVFVPFAQRYVMHAAITFLARNKSPSIGVSALRESITNADPDLAPTIAGVGSVLLDGPLLIVRYFVAMTTAVGTLALVLSMVGLFGVLSHLVSKRTREFGIRLAMGAERADIFRLVLHDGLRPVAKGLALGLFIGVAARIAVKAWVATDVAAFDPLPLLLLPVPFAIAACLASYVPAARAARVDPTHALRDL